MPGSRVTSKVRGKAGITGISTHRSLLLFHSTFVVFKLSNRAETASVTGCHGAAPRSVFSSVKGKGEDKFGSQDEL